MALANYSPLNKLPNGTASKPKLTLLWFSIFAKCPTRSHIHAPVGCARAPLAAHTAAEAPSATQYHAVYTPLRSVGRRANGTGSFAPLEVVERRSTERVHSSARRVFSSLPGVAQGVLQS